MGYRDLVGHLTREAADQGRALVARAREEAERTLAKAREEADAMERRAAEEAAREALRLRRARMTRARSDVAAIRVRARAALAERILALLEERLTGLVAEPRYSVVADRLFRELLPELPAGNLVVHADDRVRGVLGPLAADPRCRVLPLPERDIGGLVVSDEGETLLLRNTLRARLEKARPALLVEIGRRMAGPDE